MTNKWYELPTQTKVNAYTQIAEERGMTPYAVEKDWWVVQTLSAIFQTELGKYLIFKGGTSLSKAWGLIERFSEDIDLAFDRSYLGYGGELSRTQIKKLRQKTGKFIADSFAPELEEKLKANGLNDVTLNYLEPEASDSDPAKIEVFYPNVIEYPGYIQPRVLLEISSSSLKEPNQVQAFSSLLDEHYADAEFTGIPVNIPTAIPERTFLEKIFLLHEEFQRPHDRIRVDRLSRHLYDVFQLINRGYAENAIKDKELYETIVVHRRSFFRVGGVDYNQHQPQTINPVPIPKFIKAWEADYKTMQEQMIYGDSPSFEKMINVIQDFIANVINKQEWKMNVKFPKP